MTEPTVSLGESSVKMLAEARKISGLTSDKAAVESALLLFSWAVREVQKGNSIAAIDEEKKVFREVSFPVLDAVAPIKI